MVPNSFTRQSHTQLTLKISHEPKTLWVCTIAWRNKIWRHTTNPAWYTSDYPRKSNCEMHMGIPWSKGMVSWSLNEPLSIPSHLCHQKKRITIPRLRWISPHNNPLPYNSPSENSIIAARKLAYALRNPAPQAPFSNIDNSQIVAIEQLYKIFSKAADNVKKRADPP